ncbi:MAG: hypothetical protein IH943_07535 [Acidobacteria bacterium]|nr:hypothetical protein [Acidobacteriota bacterium]
MSGFTAALKVKGDTEPLQARLEVENGRLIISAANQSIGDWNLEDLDIGRTPEGFRFEVEGEELLLEVSDPLAFEEAIGTNDRKAAKNRTGRFKGKSRKSTKQTSTKDKTRPDGRSTRQTSTPAKSRPDGQATKQTTTQTESTTDGRAKRASAAFLTALDKGLDRAEKSWGSLLPEWVFTRGTAGFFAAGILVMLILPGIFSTVLLIGGFLLLVLGAVVYTDSTLAARILPGRATAAHVLIVGVGILVFGFVLALLAN